MPTTRAVALALLAVAACERADQVEQTDAQLALPGEASVGVVQRPHPVVAREEKSISSAQRWFDRLSNRRRHAAHTICETWVANPCAGMMPPVKADGDGEDSFATLLASFEAHHDVLTAYCDEAVGPRGICDTPLVVAFDAQPIDFVPASVDLFAFRPGEPASTDWPTAATPWIAIDLDGDGAITSGAELFGDSTRLPDGSRARNGYDALAALDANRDGVIDRADPAFASLLLWADADGNRASSPGELRPLSSVVIAIPLAHRREARCGARGTCEGERGAVQWRDGAGVERTGAVVDVYLPRR
jgi:hypothetical protein